MKFLHIETDHSEPIVCCSAPNTEQTVASGCEGGLLCFSSLGSQKCIGSIQFGSSNVCTSVESSQQNPWLFFCSVGSLIHSLDIRKGYGPISICNTFHCGEDEINSISLSPSEKWLSAGDDEGEIYCFDMSRKDDNIGSAEKSPNRILRRGHQNICSSVLFSKSDEKNILSGGLDCLMIRWNVPKLKASKVWTMPNITTTGQRALNPPMVHDIDTSMRHDENKEIVAIARGDGSVAIYDANARSHPVPKSKKQAARNQLANPDSLLWMAFPEDNCHTSACNAVCFTHDDRGMMLSAGNDGYLKLWNWKQDKSLVEEISTQAKVTCSSRLDEDHGSLGIIGDVKGILRVVSDI